MNEIRNIKASFDKANPGTIGGYAIKWNSPSLPLSRNGRKFTETIRKGSVEVATDCKILWGHDDNNVLGSVNSGTAIVKQDDIGVWIETTLPDSAIRERESIGRGDVDGFSPGFSVISDEWNGSKRELTKIKLNEISIVAFPAYPQALITSARSRNENGLRLREKIL